MPLGLVVPDGPVDQESLANRDPGAPLGKEHEIAAVLAAFKRHGVKNVVWITADVHYCAAHYYDPAQAAFADFSGFWEFVAGPLHAGSFGPNKLDKTFGPTVVFERAPAVANASPYAGYQFFGEINIDAQSKALTVDLIDIDGVSRYQRTLAPQGV